MHRQPPTNLSENPLLVCLSRITDYKSVGEGKCATLDPSGLANRRLPTISLQNYDQNKGTDKLGYQARLRAWCEKLNGCVGFSVHQYRHNAWLHFISASTATAASGVMKDNKKELSVSGSYDTISEAYCQSDCQITDAIAYSSYDEGGSCWTKSVIPGLRLSSIC